MKLHQSQLRIIDLMTIFVQQIKGGTKIGYTDLNRVAETILVPLLTEVLGYTNLRNLNYTVSSNYPSVDLGDEVARVAFQVTATATSSKIKETLEKFMKYGLYEKYDRLVFYFLTEKQHSYSGTGWDSIVGGQFVFDKDKDILDYTDILAAVSNLQIDKVRKIEEILEANFGDSKETLAEFALKAIATQNLGFSAYSVANLATNYPNKAVSDTAVSIPRITQIFVDTLIEITASGKLIKNNNTTVNSHPLDKTRLEEILSAAPPISLTTLFGPDAFLDQLASLLLEEYVIENAGNPTIMLEYRSFILRTLQEVWKTVWQQITQDTERFREYVRSSAPLMDYDVEPLLDQVSRFYSNFMPCIQDQLLKLIELVRSLARFNTYDRLDILLPELSIRKTDSFEGFYKGNVEWNDIIQDYDIRRNLTRTEGTQSQKLYEEYLKELIVAYEDTRSRKQRIVKIFGESGSGKTTLLMRLAFDLNEAGYSVLFTKIPTRGIDAEEVRQFHKEKNSPVFVFVDDAGSVVGVSDLYELLKALGHTFPVVLVIAAHPAYWSGNTHKTGIGLNDSSNDPLTYSLESLSLAEIRALLEKLEQTGNLGKIQNYDMDMRVSVFFEKVAEKQLLVALREAIEAPIGRKRFDEIICEEHASLSSTTAREAYETVALLHS